MCCAIVEVKNAEKYFKLRCSLAKAMAFIHKDLVIATSYKLQFMFQLLHVFFSVAVIYFIGKLVGYSGGSSLLKKYNADYFSFALIGLATSTYLKAGLVTIKNDIRQLMNQGTLEAMCAAPMQYKWLLSYSALWPFLFKAIRILFYFAIGEAIFGLRLTNTNWFCAFVTLGMPIPIFLLLGIALSSILIVVKKCDPVNWIFSNVATLLALLLFLVVLVPVTLWINNVCMKIAKKSGAFTTH